MRTQAMRAETDTLRSSSRSPFRDALEHSIKAKYLNTDESANKQLEESSFRLRTLESNKIQIESENKAFLEQIGKLHAENKVLKQEIDRLQNRELLHLERFEREKTSIA